MRRPSVLFSLRTELLVSFALLTVAALIFAVASVLLLSPFLGEGHGVFYLSLLIAADVCVLVAFGAYQVEREVLRPLRDAVDAAEAIAAGDLHRRVTAGRSREIQHLAASFNHMTDRLLEERMQLVRAEKLASVGRLAAGVAHEIGNPLGALAGYIHLLHARLRDRSDLTEILSGMERESGRIDRIVRGLLDYSRQRPGTTAPADLAEITRSVVDLLRTQGVFRRVAVELELAESSVVIGDRHELEQVFVNLLLNAADAMQGVGRVVIRIECIAARTLARGGVRRSIAPATARIEHPPEPRVEMWLAEHSTDDVAKVVIADSGPGIPAELRERIFDPFFTTKDPGRGTGLGLAIVSRSVDNANGTVWATSAREGGAAFHLLFPLARASAAPVIEQAVAAARP